MGGFSFLIVLDNTLAGDELDRVTRFLADIAAICPIRSLSGLIRHVDEQAPLPGLPMLAGDPSLTAQTGVAVLSVRYSAWHPDADQVADGVLSRDQVRQQLSELLWRCANESDTPGEPPSAGILLGNLSQVIERYDVIVCVRPTCGTGSHLTHGDQLVCQLASSGQRPLWRCPRPYGQIDRVVVAWPDEEIGPTLLAAGVRVANAWNIPFCVLSARDKRHQAEIEAGVRAACRDLGALSCEVIFAERLEDLHQCVAANDMLVMGAYGRWWPWRLITASHTETILQDLNCAALVLPSLDEGTIAGSQADSRLWPASRATRSEGANACIPR